MWLSNVAYYPTDYILLPFPPSIHFEADVLVVKSAKFERLKNLLKKLLKIIFSKSDAKNE